MCSQAARMELPAPSSTRACLKLAIRGGRASVCCLTDCTPFVTLYGPLPLRLSFLINKTTGLGRVISAEPENGAEGGP